MDKSLETGSRLMVLGWGGRMRSDKQMGLAFLFGVELDSGGGCTTL